LVGSPDLSSIAKGEPNKKPWHEFRLMDGSVGVSLGKIIPRVDVFSVRAVGRIVSAERVLEKIVDPRAHDQVNP
jgi:hypothetical protein